MRPQTLSPNRTRRLSAIVCALALAAAATQSNLSAEDFYWGSDTTPENTEAYRSWQDGTHWYTDAAGTSLANAIPGVDDHAIFSINSLNGVALNPRLYAETFINQLTFNNTTALNMTASGGNKDLHIGSGGITVAADATSVTMGTSDSGQNVFARILESQTWTNNSGGLLRVRNSGGASDSATGPVVLTMNAASTGGISNSGAWSDGAGGSLGIIVDSTGTGVVGMASSGYTGGTTIRRGILSTSGNAGAGVILLGDTTGDNTATLRLTGTTNTNNVTVQANASALNVSKIQTTRDGDSELTGDILLNDDLYFETRASRNGIVSGQISGEGDLYKDQQSGGNGGVLILTDVNTYSGDTIIRAGTLTLNDDAGLTFYIGEDGESNSILSEGTFSTRAVDLNGDFYFNFDNAALVIGNTWNIVDVDNLAETWGDTFTVDGFAEEEEGVWSNGSFVFTQADGNLTYAVPEPSSFAMLVGGLGTIFMLRRRRNSRSGTST